MAVEARYTAPCNVMITPALRSKLDKEAEDRKVSLADVVRERLERSYTENPIGVDRVTASL